MHVYCYKEAHANRIKLLKKEKKGKNTQDDEERHPGARLSKNALSGVQNPSSSLASWFVPSHCKTQ